MRANSVLTHGIVLCQGSVSSNTGHWHTECFNLKETQDITGVRSQSDPPLPPSSWNWPEKEFFDLLSRSQDPYSRGRPALCPKVKKKLKKQSDYSVPQFILSYFHSHVYLTAHKNSFPHRCLGPHFWRFLGHVFFLEIIWLLLQGTLWWVRKRYHRFSHTSAHSMLLSGCQIWEWRL